MFCFYLGSQACRKPVLWSNPGEIPNILPAALGALSSPRRPMLLRTLKKSIARFHGERFDLCPVSFSFHFLLPIILPCVWGCFPRAFQPGSRFLAELGVSSCVMSMVRHFGHVILEIWVSGFLCPSGCSTGAAPHFLCQCTLIYP